MLNASAVIRGAKDHGTGLAGPRFEARAEFQRPDFMRSGLEDAGEAVIFVSVVGTRIFGSGFN